MAVLPMKVKLGEEATSVNFSSQFCGVGDGGVSVVRIRQGTILYSGKREWIL